MGSDRFGHDRYLIDQLVRPIANLYRITPLTGDSPAGGPVAFVRQKKLAIREDIRFYADDSESEELFRIKARSVLDIGGSRYEVLAADGAPIGRLEHLFRKSLLRSTWRIVGADDREVAIARERSQVLAIARRVVDFLPYGGLVPIPYDFVLQGPVASPDAADASSTGGGDLGHFTRAFLSVRDRYTLDLSGDPERTLDRRLAVALGIALDALQNR